MYVRTYVPGHNYAIKNMAAEAEHLNVTKLDYIYSGTVLLRLRFNLNIALNRTKFKVPGQALYKCIEKSLISSNVNRVNWNNFRELHTETFEGGQNYRLFCQYSLIIHSLLL